MNNSDKTNNEERRSIDSYFFSLKETGSPKIDAILYTLADVAERLHHTKQWEDEGCIDEIQKAADDAARALSVELVKDAPSHLQAGFKVKRLFFVMGVARTSFGEYEVCPVGDEAKGDYRICSSSPDGIIDHFHNYDEAKAAAQTDFESRVRECIEDAEITKSPDCVFTDLNIPPNDIMKIVRAGAAVLEVIDDHNNDVESFNAANRVVAFRKMLRALADKATEEK